MTFTLDGSGKITVSVAKNFVQGGIFRLDATDTEPGETTELELPEVSAGDAVADTVAEPEDGTVVRVEIRAGGHGPCGGHSPGAVPDGHRHRSAADRDRPHRAHGLPAPLAPRPSTARPMPPCARTPVAPALR
ncbi:hypothetical protein [Streptomyces sp. 4N124]|uniref:hypothetical protein n=1 Tax=Streptomyces sp. 4N124 TaxID=3457420 RepID=UPI003FCF5EFB